MFKYSEVQKMFFDPLDNLVLIANRYLNEKKIIKSIFSSEIND